MFSLILLLFFSASTLKISAQTEKDPIEKIMIESGGNITIQMPASILELIKQNPSENKASGNLKKGVNRTAGYRIQVFSDGRNQGTLESRAKARGNAILAKFPKYKGQIYTFSSSPNWFTRIGNFKTSAEANEALAELKRAFPGLSSEMRVVKSEIILIK